MVGKRIATGWRGSELGGIQNAGGDPFGDTADPRLYVPRDAVETALAELVRCGRAPARPAVLMVSLFRHDDGGWPTDAEAVEKNHYSSMPFHNGISAMSLWPVMSN